MNGPKLIRMSAPKRPKYISIGWTRICCETQGNLANVWSVQWERGTYNLGTDIGDIIIANKFDNLNELFAYFAITINNVCKSLCMTFNGSFDGFHIPFNSRLILRWPDCKSRSVGWALKTHKKLHTKQILPNFSKTTLISILLETNFPVFFSGFILIAGKQKRKVVYPEA